MDEVTKLHPLHTAAWTADYIRCQGELPGLRMTGRSTALALHYLSVAIRNRGVPIKAVDHHPGSKAQEHLIYKMRDMAHMLGLQHLTFDRNSGTVTFG